jgi:IrrE N-terminal-like domain
MTDRPTSLIARLRAVAPEPPADLAAALEAARRQARALLELTETFEPPVEPAILLGDPKIELVHSPDLDAASGACRWTGSRYVIAINEREPAPQQRFTAFHEFKHAVDGAATTAAIARFSRAGRRPAAEFVADYFAACVLMPEEWVARAARHARDLDHLSRYFGVSRQAMEIRLREHLGIGRALIGAKS